MNQLVSFFAPTALPNAAGALVRAQNGAQGGDFASILAQLQNALAGDTAQPIDPIQQAAQILGQLPPGLLQSASNLSTDELAAQLQALTGAPVGENPPQIDALLALLNPTKTTAVTQPNSKPAAPDTNADTSLVAMLAALQVQTQSATPQPTQTTAEPTATPQAALATPITPAVTPAEIGLRGTVAATEQTPAQPAQRETAANAKAAENAVAALLAPSVQARPKNESQPQQPSQAQSTTTIADTGKRKDQATAAAATTQAPNTSATEKSPETPTPATGSAQTNATPKPATNTATPVQPNADGTAQTASSNHAATPTVTATPAPVFPTLIDAQQMSVTVSAAPQAAVPLEALAVQIARKFEAGISQFEISLHPAELGQLDISLSVADDGHIQAVLRAERPETLELLQRDARSLEQQLRQAGLEVGSNALSFSLSGGNGQQRHAPFAGWPAFAEAQDAAGAAKQDAAKAYIAVRNPDGIDIRV